MSSLFYDYPEFNDDISDWDVGKVTSMNAMFAATKFNQNIGSWNTAKVKSAFNMFMIAKKFDQDIAGWNVASITNMRNMFQGAEAFNQNLCDWFEFPNSIDLSFMFLASGCDALKINMMNMTPNR